MSIETTTTPTYSHMVLRREEFLHYTRMNGGRSYKRRVTFFGPYRHVEYFNAPSGLIVFAHQDTIASQVDGIHPAGLSHTVTSFRNIIEPLRELSGEATRFSVHYMTRRSQGGLILEAFGRMIDGGEPEAPSLESTEYRRVEVLMGAVGPIVGCTDVNGFVHVIHPVANRVEQVAA